MPAPSGAIPRVEAQWSHREFVDVVAPPYVMLSIVHARRLLKRGETADSYFPERTRVITTTTIADERLELLSWQDEYEIVEQFAPAMHVPTDYPVYGDDPPDTRYERARQCATGTLWIADRLAEHEVKTNLLPLIKGSTSAEREAGYRACTELGTDVVSVYAAQYFSAGGGGGRAALVRDLKAVQVEASDLDVVVIGLLSPTYLDHVPSNVIAAAGQRAWREPVAPRKQDAPAMREAYRKLADEVAAALDIERATAEKRRELEPGSDGESDSESATADD